MQLKGIQEAIITVIPQEAFEEVRRIWFDSLQPRVDSTRNLPGIEIREGKWVHLEERHNAKDRRYLAVVFCRDATEEEQETWQAFETIEKAIQRLK